MNVHDIIGEVNKAIDPKKMTAEQAVEFIDELVAELEIIKDAIRIEEKDRKR